MSLSQHGSCLQTKGPVGTSLLGLYLLLLLANSLRLSHRLGFFGGGILIVGKGPLKSHLSLSGLLVHRVLDVFGSPDARFDGGFYPGMWQAGMLPSKVDAALCLGELL